MTMRSAAGRGDYDALRRKAARAASCWIFCSVVLAMFFLLSAALLAGCASGVDSTSSVDASDGSTAEQATTSSESEADESGMDFSYSARDLDASYDAQSATYIRLSDDSAEVQGLGATATDGTVSVSAAGTYVVSGSIADGEIVVEAGDEDKVQIVLSNASVCSQDGPAISILSADKCFVTLEQDSTNALVDGSAYTLEEGADEPNAALYSKADLTLNGTGSLSIEGNWQHAVCSKDALVITGGTYDVSAVEDAFRGKDCVKIADGSFTVDAGGDGFVSTNDEDETRGFVSIDGGTFEISAQDDGIQAYTHARFAGGEFSIHSGDDAVHSDGSASIEGGTYDISAVDDARGRRRHGARRFVLRRARGPVRLPSRRNRACNGRRRRGQRRLAFRRRIVVRSGGSFLRTRRRRLPIGGRSVLCACRRCFCRSACGRGRCARRNP